MALRVWLPLNGSVENRGVSDTIMSGSPASWGNGKIGKCATFTGNAGNVIYNNTTDYNYTDKFSWAVWINTNYTGTTAQYVFTNGRADAGGYGYGLQCFSTSCRFRFGSSSYDTPVTGGEWTHLAFTKNGTKISLYKNGLLIAEHTFSGTLPTYSDGNGLGLGCFHYSGNIYPFYGSLNDFRIYDHCLSAKEVKEISQGLVLHYKLDNIIGNNLLKNSFEASGQSEGGYMVKAYDLTDNLISGEVYTITAKLTVSSDKKAWGVWVGGGSYLAGSMFQISNLTDIYTQTFTANTNMADKTFINVYVSNNTGTQNSTPVTGTAHIHWIKIEKGNASSGWGPSKNETNCQITDSSGYGNDGTILSNPYTNSDAGRYQISTYFDGVDDGILIENLTLSSIINDQVSYSFWIKPEGENGGRSIYFGSYSSTSWSVEKTTGNVLRLYWNGSPDETCSGATITDGIWQHIVITKNGTNNIKVYINGAQKWTSTATHNTLSFPTTYRIGRDTRNGDGTPYHGLMSDFRIYATALSAEDILDLYHTPANIDNLQNIHAFELKEQSGNMFAGSPMTGTVTWDAINNYYTITSNPSTSTWGIGPAVGTSPKKIIPWGMSYILTYEVYSPTAAQWYIDYNNNDLTTSLSGNDNDNSRLRTGVNVPANTWTLITYGCSNTNETKNPDHLPLYDYSTGLGPVMTNISSAITWHMRNPQWYLVDADNKEHVYENGVFQANFLKEDNQSSYTSFRNEEKAAWAHGYIEK